MKTVVRKNIKYKRRKQILIAYAARTVAVLIMTLLLALVICGFLYIVEHLFQKAVVYGEVVTGNEEIVAEVEESSYDFLATLPLKGKKIVIDAGHGGKDEGTSYGNLKEKDMVLTMALNLKTELEAYGATVIMTREDDTFWSLEKRTELANEIDADLFVSVHIDWFEGDESIHGLTCHYMQGSSKSQQYASELTEWLSASKVVSVRKEKSSDFYVLRNTQMPALLIETGYLSNEADRNNLSDERFQRELTAGIAQGICELWK